MDAGLRRQLEEAAAAMDRNLSQEIERRLRRSLNPSDQQEDALAVLTLIGGIHSQEGRDFIASVLENTCGREPGRAGALLAITLGLQAVFDRLAPGAGVLRVHKSALDEIKAAIRKLERECQIVDGKEK
jgi:hypothetical protein